MSIFQHKNACATKMIILSYMIYWTAEIKQRDYPLNQIYGCHLFVGKLEKIDQKYYGGLHLNKKETGIYEY